MGPRYPDNSKAFWFQSVTPAFQSGGLFLPIFPLYKPKSVHFEDLTCNKNGVYCVMIAIMVSVPPILICGSC